MQTAVKLCIILAECQVEIFCYLNVVIFANKLLYFLSIARLNWQALHNLQACWEPQWGPEKHSHGSPQTFLHGPFGQKRFEFFFSKWCILVYFIFLYRWWGHPNVVGFGVAYPLPNPLDGSDNHSGDPIPCLTRQNRNYWQSLFYSM